MPAHDEDFNCPFSPQNGQHFNSLLLIIYASGRKEYLAIHSGNLACHITHPPQYKMLPCF
jgi:hypothetical protein